GPPVALSGPAGADPITGARELPPDHHHLMSIFPEPDDQHSGPPPPDGQSAEERQSPQSGSQFKAAAGWAAVLVLTAVAAVVAIWQVNEQLYTPQATVEQYWEAVAEGSGSEAMGHIVSTPDFLNEEEVDHLLLDGEALARSAELIEAPSISADETSAQLDFIVGAESRTTPVPVTHSGTTWGFFDTWGVSTNALTWFEVAVPGAPQG